MTRAQICGRLKELELTRLNGDKSQSIIIEKVTLEQKLATKDYEPAVIMQQPKKQKITRKPPPSFFVDTYEGPRCDYCSGPAPEGNCKNNDGMLWPHPPM